MHLDFFFGGSCFVAALRVWPATLSKLVSYMPGNRRPRFPLTWNDGISVLLTIYACVGLMFVAVLTSTKFAFVVAAAVAMNVFTRYLLNAPTSAGRKTLAELRAFREFLSRADTDRLNRENEPGQTPQTLEPYLPYAVALGVEHGWGAEFAANLLELLQVEQAYSAPHGDLLVPDNQPTVLKLFDRNK
jgi:amino acid permease